MIAIIVLKKKEGKMSLKIAIGAVLLSIIVVMFFNLILLSNHTLPQLFVRIIFNVVIQQMTYWGLIFYKGEFDETN